MRDLYDYSGIDSAMNCVQPIDLHSIKIVPNLLEYMVLDIGNGMR